MTTYTASLISFIVGVLLASNLRGEVKASLSPQTIAPGQHARLEIHLDLSRAAVSPDRDSISINDELLLRSNDMRLIDKKETFNGTQAVWVYELTAYVTGTIHLPPVEIEAGGHTFSTERMQLQISSSRGQDDFAIREGFGRESIPFPWIRWTVLVLSGIAVCLLAAWLHMRLKKKRPMPTEEVPEPLAPSPRQWLMEQLARLRKKLEEQPDNPALIDEYTGLIRLYFSKRTLKPVEAWTTLEFRARFRTDPQAQRFSPLFDACDHFKFQPRSTGVTDLAHHCLDETERIVSL